MVKENRGSLKDVLMIAYGFPPAGGSGVIRTVKFCKYLPRFSWRPIVLTVKKPRVYELDPTLLQELPHEVEVHRTATLELPCYFYRGGGVTGIRYNKISSFSLKKLLGRLFKKLRYILLIIDERIGWVPFAVFTGRKIINKTKNVRLIYVSVKPFSSLLVAILLKRFSHLPLVIDFRDAWTDFNAYYWNDKPIYFQRFESLIEKIAIRNANKVISVTENIIKDFRAKYSSYSPEKFVFIPNGYDPEDFNDYVVEHPHFFLITYAGSLYDQRSPENFLKALKMLIEERPFLKDKVRFRYIGQITSANEKFFQDTTIKEVVELLGMLPYKECLTKIRESNLLLFIEDQVEISDRIFPTKIFEYVASGKPILALAKKGLASELIHKTKSGTVLENGDIAAIKDKLWAFIRGEEDTAFGQSQDKIVISRYSREMTTRTLAQIFNELIS